MPTAQGSSGALALGLNQPVEHFLEKTGGSTTEGQLTKADKVVAAGGGECEEFDLICERFQLRRGGGGRQGTLACEREERLAASLMRMTHMSQATAPEFQLRQMLAKQHIAQSCALKQVFGLRLLMLQRSHDT